MNKIIKKPKYTTEQHIADGWYRDENGDWIKETPLNELDLDIASWENEESTQDLILWMESGYTFHGRLGMEYDRPKLRSSQEGINRIKIWFIDEIYHAVVDYLLSGTKPKNYSKLIRYSYPEQPFEADYLYKQIKREIGRGDEWVTFKEEDNGTQVIANYPYGSLDYGIFPHTLEELHEYLNDIEPFIFDYPTYDIPDLHNGKLPIREIEITSKEQTLEDILGKTIPSNCILDKTICGVGATWLEIHADRNSVIIEPNVPVILGKMQQHSNIIGIHGEDMTVEKIAELIQEKRDKGGNVKLMTTPDSYPKIVSAIKQLRIPFYNDYFMLFDECEKIVQDIDFRKNIALPIDDFFDFKNKAMVSATPIIIDDPRFSIQNFEIIKVVPTYEYRKDLKLIGTNRVPKRVKKELAQLNGTVCIFYNSVEGIKELIDFLELEDEQVNIYCSTDAMKDSERRKRPNVYDSITDKLNRYNFFTSRFYSAVDIKVDCTPHVIMITQVYKRIGKQTPYSLIDPETEAIQIAGRFRNGISELMHITNTDANLLFKDKEELEQFLKEQHEGYKKLDELKEQAESEGEQYIIKQAIENTDYVSNGFVTNDGRVNYFRYNNAYLDERLKMLYCNPARLYRAYSRTGAFNIISWGFFEICSDKERAKLKKKSNTPKEEKIKILYDVYCKATDFGKQSDEGLLNEFREDYPLYIEAFELKDVGFHGMNKLRFMDSKIEKAVKDARQKVQATQPKICNEVYSLFNENTSYPNADIKEHLKRIYDTEGIEYDGRGITNCIKYYFDAQPYRTEHERGWELGLKR